LFGRRLQILAAFQPLLCELVLERLPRLLGSGFVLPRDHLVLGEHLAFSHPRSGRHRHFVDACRYAAVGEGGWKLVKGSEVGRDTRGGVPLLPVPFSLVFKLLRRRHLDRRFLS